MFGKKPTFNEWVNRGGRLHWFKNAPEWAAKLVVSGFFNINSFVIPEVHFVLIRSVSDNLWNRPIVHLNGDKYCCDNKYVQSVLNEDFIVTEGQITAFIRFVKTLFTQRNHDLNWYEKCFDMDGCFISGPEMCNVTMEDVCNNRVIDYAETFSHIDPKYHITHRQVWKSVYGMVSDLHSISGIEGFIRLAQSLTPKSLPKAWTNWANRWYFFDEVVIAIDKCVENGWTSGVIEDCRTLLKNRGIVLPHSIPNYDY